MSTLTEKTDKLRAILKDYGSVLIAFSGGVDSSFLLKMAVDTLGIRTAAFTEASPLHHAWELDEARELAASLGVQHIVTSGDGWENPEFAVNPPDRCYICKKSIFAEALNIAKQRGFAVVADGSNIDDLGEFRPGRKALKELDIRSPLVEAGFTKAEIREASHRLGLPTWNRQPLACLASRFPYGTQITRERLRQVEECETFLRERGFSPFRVRYHGDLARIEVNSTEFERLFAEPLRQEITDRFRKAGFTYVTVDLDGFRSGSMDEGMAPDHS
jgi:uncharacterized protein